MEKLKLFWNKIKTFALGRKKRFYIILIVISSLVLLLDVGVRLLMPNTNMFGMAGNASFSTDMDISASGDASFDFDSSDMTLPDTDTDVTFDTDAVPDSDTDAVQDFSGFASGDAAVSGTAPDMSAAGDMSDAAGGMGGGTDIASGDVSFSGSMPDMDSTDGSFSDSIADGNTDSNTFDDTELAADSAAESADASASDSGSSFSVGLPLRILMGIRSAFLPIFIIAALVDALSIFLLVLVSKKERREEQAAEQARIAQALEGDGEVHIVRPKQKKKTSPVVWIVLIAAVILVVMAIKLLSSVSAEEASQTEATVYSAEAESGDISTVLPGAGTLTEEDAVEVSLPSEVEILKWYVSDGDTVEEGDTLAQVDTDSALSAIASVQEVITSLDEALEALEDSDTTDTVTASAAGRVKAVYAEEDTSVIDTIYESGSLILLSLDGLMAVSFESDDESITVGDSVTVTLSDGTQETGTVESAINETVVITLTDEDTELGDSVTVTDADGNTLGSGALYIHSELKVLSFSGTVSSVSVSVEDEVSAGDTLLSLEDVDNTFETALLVEQRSTLEEQIATLFKLYRDGYLYAETAGVVSGISSDSVSSDSSDADSTADAEETAVTSAADLYEASGGLILTAAGNTEETEEDPEDTEDTENSGSTEQSDDTGESEDTEDAEDAEDTESTGSYLNYIGIVISVDDEGQTAEVMVYTLDGSDLSGSTAEAVTVDLSSAVYVYSDGTLSAGSISDISAGDTLILMCSSDADLSGEETALTPVCAIAVSAASDSDDTDDTDDADDTDDSDSTEGTDSTDDTDSSDDTGSTGDTQNSGTDAYSDQQSGDTQQDESTQGSDTLLQGTDTSDTTSDLTSELASVLAESTGTTEETATAVTETLTEEVSTSYAVSETTLLSITPQDYVYVTITVDELDILSLEVGLEAQVTLDAFPGQSFSGVVESIDLSGTNSGGNSKYTAVVRIDREEDMLAGMNASVRITLDTAEDVLCVPAEAIVEDENGTWVYTSYDEKTGELGDPVEVATGVSDGTNVEITSGLSAGDTYYYSVLDTVNYSTSTVTSGSGFSFSFSGSP